MQHIVITNIPLDVYNYITILNKWNFEFKNNTELNPHIKFNYKTVPSTNQNYDNSGWSWSLLVELENVDISFEDIKCTILISENMILWFSKPNMYKLRSFLEGVVLQEI